MAVLFARLAFWDRRALRVLDATEREDDVVNPDIDVFVNGVALPQSQERGGGDSRSHDRYACELNQLEPPQETGTA